jgi:hypothetical protein
MQFFADEKDVPLLLDRLNRDPELAFIVDDGLVHPEVSDTALERSPVYGVRRKVVNTVSALADGRHRLWHSVGHPLVADDGYEATVIADPWAGWTEWLDSAPRSVSLGAISLAAHAPIALTLYARHRPYTQRELHSTGPLNAFWLDGREFLASSEIGWVGNRYASLGAPAHPATIKWWTRLRSWLRANTVPLTPSRQVTFYAFPSALRRLQDGIAYYACQWPLEEALQKTARRT